jgi:translation initiation factor IF-3
MQLMNRVEEDLKEWGTVESAPKFEGRQVIMVIAPRKGRKPGATEDKAEQQEAS